MTTAQDQQSRAEFEAKFIAAPYSFSMERTGRSHRPGGYREYRTQCAWEAWQAARALPATSSVSNAESGALPAGVKPVGVAGTMPGTSGFTMACFRAEDVPVGTDLYTAAQVQAMGRVLPGWQAVPVEPTGDMLAALSGEWHSSRHRPDRYAAMLAAAPRPPAAPHDGNLLQAAQAALDLLVHVKKAPRDAGYIDWQAGVVEQQLLEALEGVPAAQAARP